MHPQPRRPTLGRVAFAQADGPASRKPLLAGLRQSEKEAYQFILEFLERGDRSQMDKLKFLQAVETLSGAVRAQANGTMDDYFPKTVLAKKIETLILEEASEQLTSAVCQQAMLCVVALSQVDPPFSLSQKLDLVTVGVSRVFALSLVAPSRDSRDYASLYFQTAQALEDMLQALVMDGLHPNMVILQEVLEIILPWLTMSEKVQEQVRALCAASHMLRFICNFPQLLHMEEFSISGKLMGTLGLFCMSPQQDICTGAAEGLHYLFQVLVLHRRGGVRQKTEVVLKNLQKHFLGEWFVHMQNLTMFFRKYLTPEERADMILVLLEAVAGSRRNEGCTAAKILETILTYSMPDIGKVPEIVQYVYRSVGGITEAAAQATVKKVLHLLAQTHMDDVILTLFKMQGQARGGHGGRRHWEILASCPGGYQVIMERLIQRLTSHRKPGGPEPGRTREISALIATRALQELLLEPCRRTEVQALFSSLLMALLFQTSCLVRDGGSDRAQDPQPVTQSADTVRSSVEALKTLLQSAGYGDHVSYVQKLGGWELLTSPEGHYEGVTLLARAMVVKNCWHIRPTFRFIVRILQEPACTSHFTALTFLTELLQCPDAADAVDDVTVRTLASWFQSEDPATVKLLLQVVETFAKHRNMARQLRLLQPFVLNCCYSRDGDVVTATLRALQHMVEHLQGPQGSSLLVQLTFTLRHFFEEDSEHLRSMAFEIYEMVLAKVKRMVLVFPLRHQVLSLVVLLVLHLQDRNMSVVQVCRQALCHTATVLSWPRLRAVCAEKDAWTILRTLLEKEAGHALWFLKQAVDLFRSSQAPIRQAAVWFAGQIMQTLDADEASEVEEARAGLWSMRDDPDPAVSCLATQTLHVVEAKRKRPAGGSTSCFCCRWPCGGDLGGRGGDG